MADLSARAVRALAIALATLIAVPFYLPPLRGLIDGESYGWGVMMFGHQLNGYGTGGDYAFLLGLSAAAWGSVIALWRAPRRWAGRIAALWFAVFAASSLVGVMVNGPMILEGDTLEVQVDLTWLFVGAPLAALLAALWLAAAPDAAAPAWRPTNGWFAGLAAIVFCAAAVLLMIGEPHAATDEWGVLALMANLVVIQGALAGWSMRRNAPVAVVAAPA